MPWEVKTRFSLYVDDLELSMAGSEEALNFIFPWAVEVMTLWVTAALRKRLAVDKLACIVASPVVRKVAAKKN